MSPTVRAGLLAGGIVFGAVIVSGAVSKSLAPRMPAPANVKPAGQSPQKNDPEPVAVSVVVRQAFRDNRAFCVQLELLHHDPTRTVPFKSWGDVGTEGVKLKDDLGNSYRQFLGRSRFSVLNSHGVSLADYDAPPVILAGRPVWDGLVFEGIVPAARSLTLDLPARRLGSGDFIRLKIIETQWLECEDDWERASRRAKPSSARKRC
jgi:hypothetical protein